MFDSFLLNGTVLGSISSRRWMVFASKPVVSVIRPSSRSSLRLCDYTIDTTQYSVGLQTTVCAP